MYIYKFEDIQPKKINPRKGKDIIYFLTLNEGNRKVNHFDVMFNLK